MKKELLNENRPKIILALVSLAVLLLLMGVFFVFSGIATRNNDAILDAAIGRLTYTEDAARAELDSLIAVADCKSSSDAAKGRLYRSMAEVSYMIGDDMLYKKYAAGAFYYLGRAGDGESQAYLVDKYIGRLYANGSYASANLMLDRLSGAIDISSLSLELQASYYLSRADIMQMINEDSGAFMQAAEAAILLMPSGSQKELHRAKLELLSARSAILGGDFGMAAEILSRYSENDDFELGEKQVYVVCDFRIPYYELMARLACNSGDLALLKEYTGKYIDYCDMYKFRAMKLNLISYIVASLDDGVDDNEYVALEKSIAGETLDEMTNKYGEFLLADIKATTEKLELQDARLYSQKTHMFIVVVAVYLLILFYSLGSIFMNYVNKDGLTRLNNRRKYERARLICERKHIPYCLLMLDIDDFKKVNDTFGHLRGDEVLKSVSGIILSFTGRGIFAYRYGGEEMCMMLLRVPETRAREIAEEIRRRVEKSVGEHEGEVTVSIGIGVSERGENVFQEADRRLYTAKQNGKNAVCNKSSAVE
ncbi:MAG: GGDEF domain-containing protein [Eubacteriales bacterium]|nr:GGDEF domain-containing protein [Eubacteriales bacterium]MDD3882033.1 GGDEF domain-containing protein [Eubacteriales bacterium]MDD4512480.1 GGDEF domain-containing protein [Eubacteriales bacterium]